MKLTQISLAVLGAVCSLGAQANYSNGDFSFTEDTTIQTDTAPGEGGGGVIQG